jgi:autotransporter-associated beta strand protein
LVVGGSNNTTFGGVINNGSGVVGLTKSGAGTLLLTGANGFTGGVALNGGTLGAGSANAIGSSGAISFGGGTLQYSASNTTDYSGRFSNAASQQYSIDTNGQNVTLASNLTSSGGSFTKLGVGGMTLSGNNSYSAGTLVSQGALVGGGSTSFGSGAIVLGDGNTGTNGIVLMVDNTDSTTIANNITVANLGTGLVSIGGTNTGVGSFNAWTGTLTLNRNVQVFNDTPHSGGRTSFIGQITGSGGITVTQGRGRVTLQNGTNDFTGPVVVNSGATLQLDVASGLNEVIPNSAAVTVNGALNFASGGGTETIGSLSGSGTVSSVVAGTYRLVVGGSNNTTFGGVINNGSGVVGLTKSGAGTLLLTGANGFTGGVALNGGTLGAGSANALGSSGAISFGGGTLQYSASNTTDYSGRFSNAASQQYSIDTNGQNVTLASNLTSSGGSFTKLGIGTVSITGSNSYSGGTTITSGTVEVSAGGSVGGSAAGLGTGAVSVGSGAQVTYWLSTSTSNTIANAFSLSGGTLHSEDGSNNFAGLVTLASGASTISSRNGDTITLSGGLAGSGDVLFTQAGGLGTGPTFALSGTGSNTGTVRVSGSANGIATKLQLANVNALQIATLDMATGDLGTVEFTVAGNNTYSLGGLQGARNLAVGSNSLSVGGNNQSTTYSGDLSASGLFTKVGSGTLTLSGSNSAAAGVAVNAGTLGLGSANAIGSTGTISFGGGYLQFSASNTTDYSGRFSNAANQQYRIDTNGQTVTLASALTSSGGSLTKNGLGTLILTATSGFTGATAVDGGRLLVNGQLGNTAVAVNASGMLGGSGTILGAVTVNSSGTLSPGNSPGVLTVGSLSLMAGSTTLMEITGTAAGLYDQVVGNGSGGLTYGGTLDLVVSGSYADGTTFNLFSNFSSNNGDFADVSLDAIGEYAGLTFSGTDGVWTSTWTENHQRLVFSTTTGNLVVVPEPSTYAMVFAGLACGGWQMFRRRRRQKAA